jgi:hypothetical protein
MRLIEAFSNQNDRESWFSRQGRLEFAIYLSGRGQDWQQQVIDHFRYTEGDTIMKAMNMKNLTLICPKLTRLDNTKGEMKKQIMWEHSHMRSADAIAFYFSEKTCPTNLLHFGKYISSNKKIFLCLDTSFDKTLEVFAHARIEKPELNINYNVEDLIEEMQRYVEGS